MAELKADIPKALDLPTFLNSLVSPWLALAQASLLFYAWVFHKTAELGLVGKDRPKLQSQ